VALIFSKVQTATFGASNFLEIKSVKVFTAKFTSGMTISECLTYLQKVEDMMSAAGGSMGLYIGASFLTIFEFLHFLGGVMCNVIYVLPAFFK
jgi:hypothetical protein